MPAPGTAARRIEGTARLGRRTKRLVAELEPGDVAVIEHPDLDRLSAEGLVRSAVACVVNVATSSSGRYPNEGPVVLARAGVPLVDAPGAALFRELSDGDLVVVEGGRVMAGGRTLATGRVIDRDAAGRALAAARGALTSALEAFAENTLARLHEERGLVAGSMALPGLTTCFRGRPAVVAARGRGHEDDVRALRPFVETRRPALVGVDGGADVLLAAGLSPDVIVGDMDSASDAALRCGAELLLHAYPDGHAPGGPRLDELGLAYRVIPAVGTSEDVALLLAAELGARPVVSVGSPLDLVEFLDRARDGMASTFLTRLRIGEVLVDARGLSRLYPP
jgi:uncharacterized membrane-anchored protein